MDNLKTFISQTAMTNSVILDTNVYLLYIYATTLGIDGISKSKRFDNIKGFEKSACGALNYIMNRFNYITVTPGILSETNNLIENDRKDYLRGYIALVNEDSNGDPIKLREMHVDVKSIVGNHYTSRLGIVDSTIIELSRQTGIGIITNDIGLYLSALSEGVAVLNLSHYYNLE